MPRSFSRAMAASAAALSSKATIASAASASSPTICAPARRSSRALASAASPSPTRMTGRPFRRTKRGRLCILPRPIRDDVALDQRLYGGAFAHNRPFVARYQHFGSQCAAVVGTRHCCAISARRHEGEKIASLHHVHVAVPGKSVAGFADWTNDSGFCPLALGFDGRSEEHTSELQSLMRISYAVFCLKKKNTH